MLLIPNFSSLSFFLSVFLVEIFLDGDDPTGSDVGIRNPVPCDDIKIRGMLRDLLHLMVTLREAGTDCGRRPLSHWGIRDFKGDGCGTGASNGQDAKENFVSMAD